MPHLIAELKALTSTEFEIASEYPEDPACFDVRVDAAIGMVGSEGGDLFAFSVCTPAWLQREALAGRVVWGHHRLVVGEWNVDHVRSAIAQLCRRTSGESWQQIAQKLSAFGAWEFDDYTPPDL